MDQFRQPRIPSRTLDVVNELRDEGSDIERAIRILAVLPVDGLLPKQMAATGCTCCSGCILGDTVVIDEIHNRFQVVLDISMAAIRAPTSDTHNFSGLTGQDRTWLIAPCFHTIVVKFVNRPPPHFYDVPLKKRPLVDDLKLPTYLVEAP